MQTIGERLEEARKRKGISIREAAEATKIRGDYLHKFEGNQFDINLPEIYVRGFLRTYATYLKLSSDKINSDYNALGLGPAKPRSISRELYGRMDLSVASAKDAAEPATADSAAAGGPQAEAGSRNPATFVPRASGPQIDRDLLIKGGALLGGAILAVVLIIWGVGALTSSDSPAPSPSTATTPAATPAQRTMTLVALNTVSVTVARKNADGTAGEELFRGQLVRGQAQDVTWPGPVYITASAGENLEIEYRGQRYPTQFKGQGRLEMQ